MEPVEWSLFSGAVETVPALVTRIHELFEAIAAAPPPDEAATPATPATPTSSLSTATLGAGAIGSRGRTPRSRSSKKGFTGATPRTSSSFPARGSDGDMMGLSRTSAGVFGLTAEERKRLAKALAVVERCVSDVKRFESVLPSYVFRLSDDGEIKPDGQCELVEQQRRRALGSSLYRVIVRVNDEAISSSPFAQINPQTLTISFRQYFEFRLVTQPKDIMIDIYSKVMSRCAYTEELVASVGIPHPGAHTAQRGHPLGGAHSNSNTTHSFAPLAGWFDFCSAPPPPVSGWFTSSTPPMDFPTQVQ